MDSKIIKLLIIIFFFSTDLLAVEFKGSFKQGSFILGKTEPGSKVKIDDKKIKVTNDGYFVFGLGRDRKNNIIIKISKSGKTETIKKKFIKENIKYKKLMGCLKKKLLLQKEVYDRIKRE